MTRLSKNVTLVGARLVSTVLIGAFAACLAFAQDQTPTGFFYPRSSNVGPYAGFLALGCNGSQDYFSGQFHIGKDAWGNLGENIWAVADGTLIARSLNGWDINGRTGDATANINVGLLVLHQLANGIQFQALYGHIRTTLKIGDHVVAGHSIGTVGDWGGKEHVHFGIRLGSNLSSSLPSGAWGRPSCTDWPYAIDGWIDPISWITSQTPGRSSGGNNGGTTGNNASTTDQVAQRDVLARASSDGRFYSAVSGSFGRDNTWGQGSGNLTDLSWMDFTFAGGRAVRIFHAVLKTNVGIRYTTFFDPDANTWTAWVQAQ
jgi:murein DD-endopeptidase MepM/ murein hydrolase activator NlpD